MNTTDSGNNGRLRRRIHSAAFKAKVLAACGPGVSIAAVALVNGLNANLLRRWVGTEEQEAKSSGAVRTLPAPRSVANRAFIPIEMEKSVVGTERTIAIELRRGATVVKGGLADYAHDSCCSGRRRPTERRSPKPSTVASGGGRR